MEIFVGIDPSINSSGVTVLVYDGETFVNEHFFVITGNKLTKKQQQAQELCFSFDYCQYNKQETKDANDNHDLEKRKTTNFVAICDHIRDIVVNTINQHNSSYQDIIVYILQEGVSYGSSVRTKSVFDLAGLNYMIRFVFSKFKHSPIEFIVATPSEIKKYASGNGNCKKEVIIELFEKIYPEFSTTGIKVDDIADSYFMAKYAQKIYNDNQNDN